MSVYKPKENEDWIHVAHVNGFRNWKTIFDHEKNQKLRERPDNLVLHKNDEIFIPEKEPVEHSLEIDKKHSFVLKNPKRLVYLVLADDWGEPFSDLKFEIWVNDKKMEQKAIRTRTDGLIWEEIPLANKAEVRVWFEKDKESDLGAYTKYELLFGDLDPVETLEGIQDRLSNLGYRFNKNEFGKLEQGKPGVTTQTAIAEFQSDNGLPATGEIDDYTRCKLLYIHDGIGSPASAKEDS